MYREVWYRVLKKTTLYKCKSIQANANLWVRQDMKMREKT